MKFKYQVRKNKILLKLSKILYKLHLYTFGRLISKLRISPTKNYLKQVYKSLLSKENKNELKTLNNCPVFVLWFQGQEQMPEVIRLCYQSIKNNIKNHDVILLTDDNIKNYITLPDFIYEKYNKGFITKTHFSDIVRAGLLYKYGGTWIDSSVFLSHQLPEEYFNSEFYGPCGFVSERKKEWRYFFGKSNGWTAWFLGTNVINHPFFEYLYNAFLEYWKNHDQMIDYFLIDFTIALYYENNNQFKKLLDSRIENNSEAYLLFSKLNNKYEDDKVFELNTINKFTYKHKLHKEINNELTNYGKLVQAILKE